MIACRFGLENGADADQSSSFHSPDGREAEARLRISWDKFGTGARRLKPELSSQQFFFQRIAVGGHGRIADVRVL
jgi:hypothetical protein